MKILKFILITTFFISSAHALNLKKINYKQRFAQLKKINPKLAQKVDHARSACIEDAKFSLEGHPYIDQNPTNLGLAKLHIIDMEKGVSHLRGLDKRSKRKKNHPGRMALDLVGDMIYEQAQSENLKTYEAIMKINCATYWLLQKYNMKSHTLTSAENKVARDTGGHCWDYAHVAIRIARDLGIKLQRKNKGIHIFTAYRLPKYKNKKIFFAVDPLYCSSPYDCAYEFSDGKGQTISRSTQKDFFERPMKKEKCYINAIKKDPNRFFYQD